MAIELKGKNCNFFIRMHYDHVENTIRLFMTFMNKT